MSPGCGGPDRDAANTIPIIFFGIRTSLAKKEIFFIKLDSCFLFFFLLHNGFQVLGLYRHSD
jgi:hypothetical protein